MKDIEKKIEFEKQIIHDNNKLKDEVNILNKSLNSCIDIVASSVSGKSANFIIDDLREENRALYHKANNSIEDIIDISQKNINELNKLNEKKESSENNNDRRDD